MTALGGEGGGKELEKVGIKEVKSAKAGTNVSGEEVKIGGGKRVSLGTGALGKGKRIRVALARGDENVYRYERANNGE